MNQVWYAQYLVVFKSHLLLIQFTTNKLGADEQLKENMAHRCEHGEDSDICVLCYQEANPPEHYYERERLKQSETCKHEYNEDSTVCTKCGS